MGDQFVFSVPENRVMIIETLTLYLNILLLNLVVYAKYRLVAGKMYISVFNFKDIGQL